ncbi:MAG: carbohydrate deacetylase-like [Bacteriovoracaceae bacterium]|nr:carbohydrate deacetylase-like [Bacteriovoracaceae bacterium]
MSPAVNEAILNLSKRGLISRVSIMPNEAFVDRELKALKELNLSLGLHFNLTHHQPYRSPGELMKAWLLASSEKKQKLKIWVLQELKLQIEKMEALEIKTDYLDGHQHIHLIPGLFDEISDFLKQKKILQVRLPLDWKLLFTARFPIPLLASSLKGTLKTLGFHTLDFFYPSSSDFKSPESLLRALNKNAQKEILIHPSTRNDFKEFKIQDSYQDERVHEYQMLLALLDLEKIN